MNPWTPQAVLARLVALPISTWRYDFEPAGATPHIGPMAQDFKAAFYPGRDDTTISTMEFDGVALAAIQGLNHKVEIEKQKAAFQMEELKAENAELKQRLAALEQLVARINPKGE